MANDNVLLRSDYPTSLVSPDASAVDMREYYQPLERIHASGAHEYGVCSGLRLVTFGNPSFKVLSGIAIDSSGRHISLAVGGQAELADDPTQPGASNLGDVLAGGVDMTPSWRNAGDYYVTVNFWETPFVDAHNNIYQQMHTPHLYLQDATQAFDEGSNIVLGKVHLDANKNVTLVSYDKRRGAGVPIGEYGHIESLPEAAGPAAGIAVTVPNAGDAMEFRTQAGGSFARATLATARAAVRWAGNETVVLDAQAAQVWAKAGGAAYLDGAKARVATQWGEHESIVLDGPSANIIAGCLGNEGDVLVRDGKNKLTVALNGATGDIWWDGQLCDPFTQWKVSHAMLKQLTDGSITTLHAHGNSAIRAATTLLVADGSRGTVSATATLFVKPGRVLACISLAMVMDELSFTPTYPAIADIFSIDGVATPTVIAGDMFGPQGSPANVRIPVFAGTTAGTIVFRLRSPSSVLTVAQAVVITEF